MTEATRFPEYVTDGSHIYMWHPEFEPLFVTGKLKPSEAPVIPKVKTLSARDKAKLEEQRRIALKNAQAAVELFQNSVPATARGVDELFGKE